MKNIQHVSKQAGFIGVSVVTSIIFGLLTLIFGSVMIWALVNYNDQKNNVQGKIETAVERAKKDQSEVDQKRFSEEEKQPLKEFIGPNDLGRVSFKYPKTWSVHVANDGTSGGQYTVYLNPAQVPPIQGSGANKFALRVQILSQSYDTVLQQYAGLVKSGKLRSELVTVNGFNGQKFEGNFTQDIDGTNAIFKIRDKTLVLSTDAPTFRPDFNDIVLKDLKFEQ